MNYIVLDLEWNQASDLKTKKETNLVFEIIEIGATKLNSDKKQIDVFHEMIKPQVFHKMHQITGELINLKIEDLDNCRWFTQVCSDFLKWCGDDYIFCTWGSLDLLELQRNMDYFGMKPLSDKPIKFYDIQKLFSIGYEDSKARRTLEFAVDYLDIEKDIAFHRADSDAYYTAKVLEHIENHEVFKNYSFDTYRLPKSKKEEIHEVFNDYSKYISRGFEDKKQAMEDKEVRSTNCYLCGMGTKKKIPWFSANNGKHYYSVSYCDKHGYLKSKIRLKKSVDDQVYVVKTMKQINEETVKDIQYKKEASRELRKEKRHEKQERNK